MKGLIYRDMMILKPTLKTAFYSLPLIIAVCIYLKQGAVLMLICPLLTSFLVIGNYQLDAACKWKKASCLFPISTSKIIASRYISFMILYLIGMLLGAVIGYAYMSYRGVDDILYQLIRNMGIASGMPLFYMAIFAPCAYYFKGERLDQAMLICMVLMFLILAGGAILIKFSKSNFQYQDLNGYIFFFFLVSCFLYLCSYRISIYIYDRK